MKATNLFFLALVVISAPVAGWAQQQPELSGFLDDYPQLTPAEEESGILVWKAPNIEPKYVAAMLDQPEIFLHPDSSYKGINPDELKLLADSFRETVAMKLALIHPVVEQPQPNTIRLRFALTNVYLKKKKRPWWGWATPISLAAYTVKGVLGQKYSLMEATVEVEAVDNDTGQQLGVAVYKKGQIKGKDVKEEETSWDDLAEAMDELALVGADYFASFWADTGVAKQAAPILRYEEAQANLRAAVRTLNMVSSITAFDYLTAGVQGNKVILSGFTTGLGTRSEAEGRVKTLEWVEGVENNIEELSISGGDGQIRAQVLARLGRYLPRAFSGNRAEIRIKVNRGDVTLVGLVDSELDKGVAENQTRTVPLVRSVTNQLVVRDRSN